MSTLASLKLVAAKQSRVLDPIQLRRAKLIAKLDEQIALAKAKQTGTEYVPMRSKRIKDAEGNVSVVQQPKRLKAWFWAVDGGRVCVAVRYGNKVIELSKGKTAVETTAAELGSVLAVVRKAVEAGELDAQIEAASAGVRRGFKR
jgi:hypothetical protein